MDNIEFSYSENYIFIKDDNDKMIAYVYYVENDKDTVTILKTYVGEELRGQGIAKKIMEASLTYLKERYKIINATCSYAISYIEKYGY